jgi:FtsP/CotA-like multicopper oxidase with cupredoxin domain
MKLSRRRFVTAAGALASAAAGAGRLWPVRAETRREEDGFLVLTARPADKKLGDEARLSRLWTYNGLNPGPEIRVKRGEKVRVRLVNELDEPTMVHWHGIRIANAMDGSPLTQEPVQPGATFDYEFVAPDAGTYWYHPHIGSSRQVGHGLYGPLIVEEDVPPAGLHDVTLVLDDWLVDENAVFYSSGFGDIRTAAHGGRLGNWITVNGVSRPDIKVPAGSALRLRVVNCANARVMDLALSTADAVVAAWDGQPLAGHDPLGSAPLRLGPGGRADVLVPAPGKSFDLFLATRGEPLQIASITPDGAMEPLAERQDELPLLPSNGLPPEISLKGARTIPMVMEGGAMGGLRTASYKGVEMSMRELVDNGMVWAFNSVAGMPDAPLADLKRNETVIFDFVNRTAWPHAMHLHGHHLLPVEKDGEAVTRAAWRDTLMVEPDSRVRAAFIADNPGKWMLHCHMLEHQETGMMTWIDVA